jgi:hypothetical protein
VAVGFGALLVAARSAEGPLDDPDPAYQRPGLLDLGALPRPAPPVTGGVPAPGSEAVVFFVRPDGLHPLCDAAAGADFDGEPDLVVVVVGPAGSCAGGVPGVDDGCGPAGQVDAQEGGGHEVLLAELAEQGGVGRSGLIDEALSAPAAVAWR